MKTLIICEKDPAGEKFAEFLNAIQRDGYWETPDYYIVSARGHLIEKTLRGLKGWNIPSFDFKWYIPKSSQEKLNLIKQLYEDCDDVVIATDWDREGEVIGERIYAYLQGRLTKYHLPNRIYFSALTRSEVLKALNNVQQMNETLLAQGIARNYADTVIGLNLTKALTKIYKIDLNYEELVQALSLGRVQSPVLTKIVEDTEVEFRAEKASKSEWDDKSTYYYIETPQGHIPIKETDDDEVELVRYEEVEEERPQAKRLPNTDDAFSEIELPPHVTMEIMESLYLRGLMTYPRTKSTGAPDDVLEELENELKAHGLLQSPNFSRKYTPAGTQDAGKLPLLPTVEGIRAYVNGELSRRDLIVFTWLLKRVNLAFAPPLKIKHKKAVFRDSSREFEVDFGSTIENEEDCVEWFSTTVYPEIPLGRYKVVRIVSNKKTIYVDTGLYRRVRALSDKDIVEWMSWVGIGTEATRQTYAPLLRERKYIDEVNLPTKLGEFISKIIERIGLTTDLTAEMETRIEEIRTLSDLPAFQKWINDITKEFINELFSLDANELDVFKCPKGHRAELANRYWNGHQVLLLKCDVCGKLYPI